MTKLSGSSQEKTAADFGMTKLSGSSQEKTAADFSQFEEKVIDKKKILFNIDKDKTKCPRGFGDIRKFGEDNSVSEKCLGCHMIIECFSEKSQ